MSRMRNQTLSLADLGEQNWHFLAHASWLLPMAETETSEETWPVVRGMIFPGTGNHLGLTV